MKPLNNFYDEGVKLRMFENFVDCQSCEHNPTGDKCELFGRVIGMHGCSSGVERKPRNNFEKIKAMSMEEMAEWVSAITLDEFGDKKDWLNWLKEVS